MVCRVTFKWLPLANPFCRLLHPRCRDQKHTLHGVLHSFILLLLLIPPILVKGMDGIWVEGSCLLHCGILVALASGLGPYEWDYVVSSIDRPSWSPSDYLGEYRSSIMMVAPQSGIVFHRRLLVVIMGSVQAIPAQVLLLPLCQGIPTVLF